MRRDVHAALLGLLHLDVGAEIGPGGVVELQIAAAGVVERLHRLAIGRRQVGEDRVVVRIGLLVDGGVGSRRKCSTVGDGMHIFGITFVLSLHELEVLEHRVVAEVDLASDADALRLGLHALELDAVIHLVDLDVVEAVVEIVMPEHAAVFAVGRALQADLFLLLDDLRDFLVLDLLQVGGADLALVALGARLGDRRRAQIAADVVGAEGRRGSFHGRLTHSNSFVGDLGSKHRTGAVSGREGDSLVNPAFDRSGPRGAGRCRWDVSHRDRAAGTRRRTGGAIFRGKMRRNAAPDRVPLACDGAGFRPSIRPERPRSGGAGSHHSLGGSSMIKRVLAASAALAMSAALAHAQEVKIGLVAPFTGIGAELGQQIDRGVQQYLKLRASEFAPYKINIIKRDDKNPSGADSKTAVQELLTQDNVDALAGWIYSPNAIASAPVVTAGKKIGVIMNAGTAHITTMSPYLRAHLVQHVARRLCAGRSGGQAAQGQDRGGRLQRLPARQGQPRRPSRRRSRRAAARSSTRSRWAAPRRCRTSRRSSSAPRTRSPTCSSSSCRPAITRSPSSRPTARSA